MKTLLTRLLLRAAATGFLLLASAVSAAPTADQLAERLDYIRRPAQSFEVKITVTELKNGQPKHEGQLRVMARKLPGQPRFDTVGLCLEPAADRGKVVLVTQQQQVWFFDPKSKRPTQISPGQFRGKFFISDALSTSFSVDYEHELDGEETIQDAGKNDVPCYRLKLKPSGKKGEVVVFDLDKKYQQPIRAQFYSSSGKLLHTTYFAAYAKVLGETRPTRVLVVSNTERGVVTDIKFGEFAAREWPAGMFEKDDMPKISRGELP